MAAEIITHSAEETEALGRRIGSKLRGDETIALFGGLGMGVDPSEISSPTFAIVHEHESGDGKTLYHFDMYRVTSWEDLYSTGFFDYLDNGVLVIEWRENIEGALPENTVRITISRGEDDNQRIFETEGVEFHEAISS